MLFIGITGGVGAGKSALLAYLKQHYRCRVLLADEIAHTVMEPGTACNRRLQELFAADGVFGEDGTIDRPRMAQVLFTDDAKREALNAIVHPAVKDYVLGEERTERAAKRADLLVLEAALLIEENYDAVCDELWYIYTSEENRRKRLAASRGYSDEKISGIFASQLPEEEFRRHCAEVIDNNGTPEESFTQLDQILQRKNVQRMEGQPR